MRVSVPWYSIYNHGKIKPQCFNVVREKQSLCYYCAARFDSRKSTFIVDSGVLEENKDLLDLIANALLDKETLTKEEIDFLVKNKRLPEDGENLDKKEEKKEEKVPEVKPEKPEPQKPENPDKPETPETPENSGSSTDSPESTDPSENDIEANSEPVVQNIEEDDEETLGDSEEN